MKLNKKAGLGLAGAGAVLAALGIANLLKKGSDAEECEETVEFFSEDETVEVENIEQAE